MNLILHRSTRQSVWISLVFLYLLCSFRMVAEEKPLGKAESNWPGVVFQIMRIQRVDGTHLLATVWLSAGASAQNPTFIGIAPEVDVKMYKNLPQREMDAPKFHPTPVSLTDAVLIDQTTKEQYKALPTLPTEPFLGPNLVMTTLRPGSWIQMAVQFPAPPPLPAGPDGKVPAQRATIQFSQTKRPITDIVLPP